MVSSASDFPPSLSAIKRQALTRGRVARAETGRRKYERVKEEKRREVVWDQNTITADTSSRLIEVQHQQPPGARQYDDESIASAAKPRAADGDDAEEGGQVVVESPGADETSFPPSKPQQQPNYDAIPEAATTIQAAFRGGHARRDATKRRSARTANEAERNARALKKVWESFQIHNACAKASNAFVIDVRRTLDFLVLADVTSIAPRKDQNKENMQAKG